MQKKKQASNFLQCCFRGSAGIEMCCYPGSLQWTLWRGSAKDEKLRLIGYQEAGTGILGSSVHYSEDVHLPTAMDENLSCY